MTALVYQAVDSAYLTEVRGQKIPQIDEAKVTFAPKIKIGVDNEREISIILEGTPCVSLNDKVTQENRYSAPYVEEIVYKIEGVKNAFFMGSNPGGTGIQEIGVMNQAGNMWMITPNTTSYTENTTTTITSRIREYLDKSYLQGKTRTWKKTLALCNTSVNYDPNDMEKMRVCNGLSRDTKKGGHKPDYVCALPDVATSSFEWNTSAVYTREPEKPVEIMVSIIATIALVVSDGAKKPNKEDDKDGHTLYWVKTKHTITKKIEIDAGNNVTSPEFSHSEISQRGYTWRDYFSFTKNFRPGKWWGNNIKQSSSDWS